MCFYSLVFFSSTWIWILWCWNLFYIQFFFSLDAIWKVAYKIAAKTLFDVGTIKNEIFAKFLGEHCENFGGKHKFQILQIYEIQHVVLME